MSRRRHFSSPAVASTAAAAAAAGTTLIVFAPYKMPPPRPPPQPPPRPPPRRQANQHLPLPRRASQLCLPRRASQLYLPRRASQPMFLPPEHQRLSSLLRSRPVNRRRISQRLSPLQPLQSLQLPNLLRPQPVSQRRHRRVCLRRNQRRIGQRRSLRVNPRVHPSLLRRLRSLQLVRPRANRQTLLFCLTTTQCFPVLSRVQPWSSSPPE